MKHTLKLTDELLRDALLQAALEEAQRAQDTDEAKKPWHVSEAYAAWERDVLPNISAISAQKSAPPKRRSRAWGQVAACFALTLSLSFGGLMMASPTARAAVLRWVSTWYEDHVSVLFQGEQQEGVGLDWYPSYLPDGYVEVKRDKTPNRLMLIFEHKVSGKQIILTCAPMQQGSGFQVDNENKTVSKVVINGAPGTLLVSTIPDDLSMLIWMQEGDNLAFRLSGTESSALLTSIAESVKKSS